jgi:hypothetical protein
MQLRTLSWKFIQKVTNVSMGTNGTFRLPVYNVKCSIIPKFIVAACATDATKPRGDEGGRFFKLDE